MPLGSAEIRVVNKTKNTVRKGMAEISAIAPALFTIDCLNATAGAALNAVTFSLEPFTVATVQNGGRTNARASAFSVRACGRREQKTVSLVDTTGRRYPLAVEYAGPAPMFFGLDQINVVLAPEFDGAGVVSVITVADGVESNAVTVNIADAVLGKGLSSNPQHYDGRWEWRVGPRWRRGTGAGSSFDAADGDRDRQAGQPVCRGRGGSCGPQDSDRRQDEPLCGYGLNVL